LFAIDTTQILTAAAIFFRISCIVALLPLFGDSSVPVRVRILLSVALTVGVYPILPPSVTAGLAPAINDVGTLSIGLVLGYTAKLAFDGVIMAANMVGLQMGFNTASVFMPDADDTTNGFTALHRMLVVLIFLALNLHHVYIKSVFDSFKLIPLGQAHVPGTLNSHLLVVSAGIFAPLLVGLLFSTAALGLINRAVPQANVFVMSFPANFFVGLFLYMALIPLLPGWLSIHFEASQQHILTALSLIGR
jgi:flagellar biosynthetic protein FliR